jgi:hypothetical protein
MSCWLEVSKPAPDTCWRVGNSGACKDFAMRDVTGERHDTEVVVTLYGIMAI